MLRTRSWPIMRNSSPHRCARNGAATTVIAMALTRPNSVETLCTRWAPDLILPFARLSLAGVKSLLIYLQLSFRVLPHDHAVQHHHRTGSFFFSSIFKPLTCAFKVLEKSRIPRGGAPRGDELPDAIPHNSHLAIVFRKHRLVHQATIQNVGNHVRIIENHSDVRLCLAAVPIFLSNLNGGRGKKILQIPASRLPELWFASEIIEPQI